VGVIEIPRVVANKARAIGQDRWIDNLANLVAEIERDWGIAVGAPFPDATEALVAAATLRDGTPAVLKVIVPRSGSAAAQEITVLKLADGDACARLLRHDLDRGALLVERLGPSLHDLGLALGQRLEILSSLALRLWRPAPASGLPTGAEKARWLTDFITTTWDEVGHPCSERAVDYALACAAGGWPPTTTNAPCSSTATYTSGTP
jgi:streptomycin 6-kinase